MSSRAGICPPRKGIPLLTEPEGERLGHKTKPPCHQPLALTGLPTETKEGLPGILQGWLLVPLPSSARPADLSLLPSLLLLAPSNLLLYPASAPIPPSSFKS